MRGAMVVLMTALLAPVAAAAGPAGGPWRPTVTVSGTVFDDRDDDGLWSVGEEPLAEVVVAVGTTFVRTDAEGRFTLDVTRSTLFEGILWVRPPAGFVPGPVWRAIAADGNDPALEIGLSRTSIAPSRTFVVAADTHLGRTNEPEVREALAQAASGLVVPEFLTVVGDLADAGEEIELEAFVRATRSLGVPIVPVPGNHDWEDGGPRYRRLFGPPMYSFDAAGAHVVVLNFNASELDQLAFVSADLAWVDEGVPVVALTHAPPSEWLAGELAERGVGLLFSGHWHANRVTTHGTMLELNTETAAMGALDYTPAGYRVVTLDDEGLSVDHHVVVDTDVLELAAPRPGACVAPGRVELLASAELGAGTRDVTLTVDGSGVALTARGGWMYGADVDLFDGVHRFVLEARGGRGHALRREGSFCVRGGLAVPHPTGTWAQHQAGAAHHGRVDGEVRPPLRQAWARALGGHARGGSPAIADGIVVVPVLDLADGTRGGVVAFDAVTGATRWEHRTGASVHGTPAIADGLVVVGAHDGTVRALDLATGAVVWRVDLAADDGHSPTGPTPASGLFGSTLDGTWLYASPTIAAGRVLIGVARRAVALELRTGDVAWRIDPAPNGVGRGPFAAIAAAGDVAVGVFGRGLDGLLGLDLASGATRWKLGPGVSLAMQASPILDGDVAYLATVRAELTAVDVATGDVRWSTKIIDMGLSIDWGSALFATPAFAAGKLVVGDPRGRLSAVDASTGELAWQIAATGRANVKPLPYETRGEGWIASPIVTGGVVWAAGMDGVLAGVELATGRTLGAMELGGPALSGLAASGDTIYVATWDGAVRALVMDPEAGRRDVGGGCGVAGGRGGALAWLVMLAGVGGAGARGRRRARSA